MTASCSHESSGLGAFFAAAEADDLDRVNEKKPIAARGARSCLMTTSGRGDVVVTSSISVPVPGMRVEPVTGDDGAEGDATTDASVDGRALR